MPSANPGGFDVAINALTSKAAIVGIEPTEASLMWVSSKAQADFAAGDKRRTRPGSEHGKV